MFFCLKKNHNNLALFNFPCLNVPTCLSHPWTLKCIVFLPFIARCPRKSECRNSSALHPSDWDWGSERGLWSLVSRNSPQSGGRRRVAPPGGCSQCLPEDRKEHRSIDIWQHRYQKGNRLSSFRWITQEVCLVWGSCGSFFEFSLQWKFSSIYKRFFYLLSYDWGILLYRLYHQEPELRISNYKII